jgi:protein-arginine kinase activator protein McsA
MNTQFEDEHPDIKFLTLRLELLILQEEYEMCARIKSWIDQLRQKYKTKTTQRNIKKKTRNE